MNFECGICNELLDRVHDATIAKFLQTLARHSRIPMVARILTELGFEDGSDKQNFIMVYKRYKNIFKLSHHPSWMMPTMFQFVRIIATPCGHLFHFWCYEEWSIVRRTFGPPMCPYCRQSIPRGSICALRFGPAVHNIDGVNSGVKTEECEHTVVLPLSPFKEDQITVPLSALGSFGNGYSKELRDMMRPQNRTRLPHYLGDDMIEQSARVNQLARKYRKAMKLGGGDGIHQNPYRKYVKIFKTTLKVDFIMPFITFFLFLWKLSSYVGQKKIDYDSDEENLLIEQYYLDGYFAILMIMPFVTCGILDYTLQTFDELDRAVAHDY